MPKTKLIYNPRAGAKKHLLSGGAPLLLQDIYKLLYKYEIEFEAIATLKPGDARRLAREAAAEGCEQIIVAGGDGTVGEAANGLVGTNTALGILPLGTYMNVARMLSVPFDLEAAVMIIKIGNVRSIDVGEIIYLQEESINGKDTNETNYFLESIGIGLEADFQKFYLNFSQHRWQSLMELIEDMRLFYSTPIIIELDDNRKVETKSHLVMISNGPYMGAGLSVAPSSKLNDHMLKVTTYKMSKKELFWHLIKTKIVSRGMDSKHLTFAFRHNPDIKTYTCSSVKVTAKRSRPIDADARIFGQTPVSVTVKPNALKVITGFTESKKDSALLEKKTYISP